MLFLASAPCTVSAATNSNSGIYSKGVRIFEKQVYQLWNTKKTYPMVYLQITFYMQIGYLQIVIWHKIIGLSLLIVDSLKNRYVTMNALQT